MKHEISLPFLQEPYPVL